MLKLDYKTVEVNFFRESLGENLELKMMEIPAGQFMMGSPEQELDRLDREGPQHLVEIPRFFMGKYPITQAQWRFVAGLDQQETELKPDPSKFKGDNLPVEQISWHEAVEFCQRLSTHSKRNYQLPSEAQWEYACRAGTTTPFHFGETITTDVANYRGTDDESMGWKGNYGKGPKGEYRQKTTPVDKFDVANDFGLCEMHGNVWEWCLDDWEDNYNNPRTYKAYKCTSNYKVRRGGSWLDNRDCRSAYRIYGNPDYRSYVIGFRVVCLPRGL